MRILTILFLIVLIRLIPAADDEKEEEKKEEVGTVIGIDLGTTYSW